MIPTPCPKCLVPPQSYLGLAPYEVVCVHECEYSQKFPANQNTDQRDEQ